MRTVENFSSFHLHRMVSRDSMKKTTQGSQSSKRRGVSKPVSHLGKLPKTLPALARAQRITEQASRLGFDWPDAQQVWRKIEEEWEELRAAISAGDPSHIRHEMGDLLFSLVNLSRFLDLEAERVLSETVERFLQRFSYIETKIRDRGRTLAETPLEEMDALWEEAKRKEAASSHGPI